MRLDAPKIARKQYVSKENDARFAPGPERRAIIGIDAQHSRNVAQSCEEVATKSESAKKGWRISSISINWKNWDK